MKCFRKSTKGISPIFATLILIAIAVIAGVVVYMFTNNMLTIQTGQGATATEKVTIQAVQVNTDGTLTVYAQAQGNPILVSNVILKDAGGNVLQTYDETALNNGDTTIGADTNTVGITLTNLDVATLVTDFPATGTYTVTLVSSKGGTFVSPSFNVSV